MKNNHMDDCINFFNELAEKLSETHEVVGSCNKDCSMYLIPKGTIDELTYHSKPANSYRVSDHWNWYASTSKCENPKYIQCLNVDLPWAKKRVSEGKSSKPIMAAQVAYIGEDGKYHHLFGEKFDRKTKTWTWEEKAS